MAQVLLTVDFEAEDDAKTLGAILDKITEAVHEVTDSEPGFGLEVGGEHRDPDDPATGLFS